MLKINNVFYLTLIFNFNSLYAKSYCLELLLSELDTRVLESGNIELLIKIGWKYYKGEGVPQNNEKVFKFWEKAAELGSKEALYNLAFMHEKGLKGIPQSPEKASYWYDRYAKAIEKEKKR